MDFEVDVERAAQCKDHIKSTELLDVATTLFRSAESTVGLFFLPYGLIRLGGQFGEWARIHIKARLRLAKKGKALIRQDDREISEVEQEIVTELQKDPAWKKQQNDIIREELKRLLGIENFLNSARALVGAALVGMWAALESTSKDAWILALNARPSQLGYRALSNIEGTEVETGLTKKHIPVVLAAKHGFDLRNCLGTILCRKFDFTGLHGIQEAYIAAFESAEKIDSVLASNDLRTLEVTRHVIVHRGAVVDEEYKVKVGKDVQLGEQLDFECGEVCGMINAAIEAAANLIGFVDDWLQSHPNRPPGSQGR